MKPSVFIGSSIKQLASAYAVQKNLGYDCYPTVWNQGIFEPSSFTLEALGKALDDSDFGIFLFGPDDVADIGGQQYQVTRDNVIFELGLFVGRLGRDRSFIIAPQKGEKLRVPTDLLGVTVESYNEDHPNQEAAIGEACFAIRNRIKKDGVRPGRIQQPAVDQFSINSVLCLSADAYEQLEIKSDINILEENFPGKVEARRSIQSRDFLKLLISAGQGKNPDILHLVVSHDAKSGDLNFSGRPNGWHRELATAEEADLLPVDSLVKYLELTKPRLVVLASCDGLYAASQCFRETNVIAVSGFIGVYEIVNWLRTFYGALAAGKPLSKAYEITSGSSKERLGLFLKKDFSLQTAPKAGSSATELS
jgi:hypothetical protein